MHISDLRFATLWIYLANGLKVIMRHAAAFISKTEKLATNNQFNYPQNIYCRTGFVIQTQRRRDGARSDFLLHWVRPFSRRFVVVIARFSVCCFTPPSYLRAFTCSSCAAAPIYTYHPDPRWVCHICCFMFRLLSCLELYGLVCRRSHWPVCNTGIIWVFICSFFFFTFVSLSVWCGHVYRSIITSPPLVAPLQQVLRPLWPCTKRTTGQVMTLVKLCLFLRAHPAPSIWRGKSE